MLDIRKGLRFIDSISGCKIATESMQVLQISKISYWLATKAMLQICMQKVKMENIVKENSPKLLI